MTRVRACTIEDFGLIGYARIEFADGLTVFSGETGSGKTMLLGALRFALGERTPADVIRAGAERARVTLEIEPDDELRARLAIGGFPLDPDEDAVVVRELARAGRASARLNGLPATGAQLRGYGEAIVEVIGQHEAQHLLAPNVQLELLDRFGGEPALAAVDEAGALHARTAALERELREGETNDVRARIALEEARYAIAEIDAGQLTPDEDVAVRERRDYLANAERIAVALEAAYDALAGREGSAGDGLGAASSSLAAVAGYGGRLRDLNDRLSGAQSEVTEIASALAREREATEFDAAESERLAARLDTIERLKRKYGGSVPAIFAERERFAAIVENEAGREQRSKSLGDALARATSALNDVAARLSTVRAAAATQLAAAVANELAALAMPAARFAVRFERLDAIGPRGAERVEFMLAPNPGEPPRALGRAASGGERSRVLLALVVVLADRRKPLTLVFDEIDAGIGGATATAVGVRFEALVRAGAQILCVTHLAQIASCADVHYVLRKEREGPATRIVAERLATQPATTEEIARMLSGSTKRVALEHAGALLGEARTRKRKR